MGESFDNNDVGEFDLEESKVNPLSNFQVSI